MTYCVAMRLDQGMVFLSDSRTNAGVDHINTFRKMTVFERPGDRVIVLMTAGNLAISQAVRQMLVECGEGEAPGIWTVPSMLDVAQLVGEAIRKVHARDAEALSKFGVEFNVSFIVGGQIGHEAPRLFNIYSPGNYIEAQDENCYFQIGEAKYGKPILDRVVNPTTALDEAAKCALISMDSTVRSNISVGLPLDLLVYARDTLRVDRFVQIDERNQYWQMIRSTWGQRLKQVFQEIPDPRWESTGAATETAEAASAAPPAVPSTPAGADDHDAAARSIDDRRAGAGHGRPLATSPMRAPLPAGLGVVTAGGAPQTVAGDPAPRHR